MVISIRNTVVAFKHLTTQSQQPLSIGVIIYLGKAANRGYRSKITLDACLKDQVRRKSPGL